MTLDDEQMTAREDRLAALRRDRQRDWALREADMEEQRACESVEAMETYWAGVMAQGARHYSSEQLWDGTS